MITVPNNLKEFYFCIRPAGERVFINIKKNKLLIISMYGEIIDTICLTKGTFNATLLEGYYLKEKKLLIISDLLVWK